MTFVSLLSLFFFFLPFQFALSPTEGVDMASIRLVTLFIFFLWLIRSLVRKKLFLPDVPVAFFLSGFLLVALSSGFWAEEPLFTLRKALFLCSFAPLLLVLYSCFKEDENLSVNILKAFVTSAFFAALLGLGLFFAQFLFGVERVFAFLTTELLPFFLGESFAQSVALHPSLLVNLSGVTVLRASGIFPDPHMFAFYLGMALPLTLAWFLSALSKKERFLVGSMLGAILLADLFSFSRGGYVGLVCGGIVFLFFSNLLKKFSVRKKIYASIGVMLFLGLMLVTPVGSRFLSSFSRDDGSNQERLRLFEEALSHIAERPLLGVGLGNYPLAVDPLASYRDPIYAHNLFLDITVEMGMLGLFFFLGLIVLALKRVFLFWKGQKAWFPLAILSALFVFLGHAFFETPLFSVHVFPVFLLLISVGVSYPYEALRTK